MRMSSRRPRHRDPRRKWRLGQPTRPSPTSLSLAQKAKGCFRPSLLPAGRTDESCAAGAGALSLLPATRGILAAHAYTTPLCACAAAVHPSQQPQLAIVGYGRLRRVLSLRSSSNLARCKWNHRAARAWASCPTWCATSDGGGRPSINFSEVCGPLAQPTTVPAVALGAAGSRAASGTHVHPSCRVQLMAALASSTFATVQLLRESAAVGGKQPRRAGFWALRLRPHNWAKMLDPSPLEKKNTCATAFSCMAHSIGIMRKLWDHWAQR